MHGEKVKCLMCNNYFYVHEPFVVDPRSQKVICQDKCPHCYPETYK